MQMDQTQGVQGRACTGLLHCVAITCDASSFAAGPTLLQRGPWWAAQEPEKEVAMTFKLTRNDLAAKSSRELVHLFTLASQAVGQAPRADPQYQAASALIAMIKAEQAKRGPTP